MKGPLLNVGINDSTWTLISLPAYTTCVNYTVTARTQKKFYMRPVIGDENVWKTVHEAVTLGFPEVFNIPGDGLFYAKTPNGTSTEILEVTFITS